MDSIKQRVNKIISDMSLDEKLAQIGSYWMYELQTKGELDQKKITNKLMKNIN